MERKIGPGAAWAVGLVAAMVIAGCTLNPPAGTPVASAGIMTRGSAILNGVRYEDGAASVSRDGVAVSVAQLDDGMRIKLKGTRNDDGLTGTADRIEVENEVRGSISAVNAASQSFTVLGHQVFVDANTVYANGSAGDLLVDAEVEVHGQRNAAGDVLASRVEFLGGVIVDEVRGVVTSWTVTTFQLVGSSLTFTWNASTAIIGAAGFANGDLVEVHLNGTLATRIELEDAEDAEFTAEGEQELHGFVSGFTAHPGSFLVDGQQVSTSAATRFEDGDASDLDNDMVVEAEGQLAGGILVAEKITFKDSVRLHGDPLVAGSADLFGLDVVVNGLTEFRGGLTAEGDIDTSEGLRVRGYLNAGGTLTATRLESTGSVDFDKEILQGVVTSISAPDSLVIAGITVDLTGSSSIHGDDDLPLDLATFFARLTAGRSVVKARGSFVAGPPAAFAAEEVSIE